MLALGAIALAGSVIYASTTLAFSGLGLIFLGALFLYIRPEKYTKNAILEAALTPSFTTLNQMVRELGYKGDATYLPPRYFANQENAKIYISKHVDAPLPMPEVIQLYENQAVARTAGGVLITPPGIQLSRLLEKSLGKSFTKIDLENLQRNLPKLFVEDLEIAENLEIQTKDDTTKDVTIQTRIIKPFYTLEFKEAEEHSQTASSIGGPICSAIAIAITKATGKPLRIVGSRLSEDGNTLEAEYAIIEE